MRKLLIALTVFIAGLSFANAQFITSDGFIQASSVVSSYQGPGDVLSGAFGWYSCARAYNAAYAAPGTNPACDVVDSATGLTTCTFHVQSTGFVNPTECNATACATACKLTKAYDQSGSTHDEIQTNLSQMPTLVPSGLAGLPTINCGTGPALVLGTTSTFTVAQPITFSAVAERAIGVAAGGAIGGNAGAIWMGTGAGANLVQITGGTALAAAATDSAYHALNGLANGNGTSSAINVDASDTLGAAGTAGLSSTGLLVCRAQGAQYTGFIAEAGMWAVSTTATVRSALSANQHSATNGYNF